MKKIIGNGRFTKSVLCVRNDDKSTAVIVKIYIIRDSDKEDDVDEAIRAIQKIGTSLGSISKNPNVLPYRSAYISSKMRAAYVTRQHISVSLYDRLSTRPFLQAIEKKWIAFQLLKALEQCEAADAFHGDIKAENILVTSWNWIFLTTTLVGPFPNRGRIWWICKHSI